MTQQAETTTVPDTVTVTIDGREVEARPGELVIAAAERNGVYIPRFCWHPRMKPVGMCRMCLVEIDGVRGLPPSCTTPVADGMVVHTESPAVKKVQDGVLEFLLINHPLDCPVCDRGGECPLQDQTFAFGPGESRFVEEKRHYAKPISISPLVHLDRERCVLCARCTRFADELAGDPLISFVERGNETQVLTFPDDPFNSYFSGNTVQICPVGALLAKPYRFRARPWDLDEVESSCNLCAVGCRVAVQGSSNRIVRHLGIDSDPVNHSWLCDKGRFGFEALNSEERLTAPLILRRPTERAAVTLEGSGGLTETTWGEALNQVANELRNVRELHGPDAIGVIGGARLTNEDAYAWTKFAKSVLRTDNVDCQLGDGLPAEVVLGLPKATIADACAAPVVVLLGPDLKEELPVLYLRLRGAALDGHTLVEVSPRDTGLTRHAAASLRYRPGEAAEVTRALVEGGSADADVAAASELVRSAPGVVVVLGRPSLSESASSIASAASALARLPGVRFLSALRRGNVHGALDMGMAPGVLPGRVSLDGGREWFIDVWGGVPEHRGLDAAGMLAAAAEGRMHALLLLGADPLSDFPDRALARRGLSNAGFVVAVDMFRTASVELADVVLPAAGYAEKSGSATNIEGRVTRLGQKVTAPGTARADWEIAVDVASRVGTELGFDTLEMLSDEVARVAPAYSGVTTSSLRQEKNGFVVPLAGVEREGPELLGAPDAADPGSPPAIDAYSLRLVTSRDLYDDGVHVVKNPFFAPLRRPAVLRLNHYDLDRLGVAPGGDVRVTSPRASLVLPVASDDGVPRGSAFLTYNLGAEGAADLLDAAAIVTDVRVETV